MFARTKRLVLRPGWAEDAQALADAIGHEDVLRNLLRAPMPYDTRDRSEGTRLNSSHLKLSRMPSSA